MRLDAYLRAHEFMRVERPPLLWEADTEETPFLALLGEMIAAPLARRNELSELVLNVSNVTVEESAADHRVAQGDYVAITVRGGGDWKPEEVWWPEGPPLEGVVAVLDHLREAGGVYAYSRSSDGGGSITVFLPRLQR